MKTIVFVRNSPTPRICNEVFALKKTKKYRLVLLCETFNPGALGSYTQIFDEIICCLPPVLDLKRYGLSQNIKNSPAIHHIKQILTLPMKHPMLHRLIRNRMISNLKNMEADAFNCVDTYDLTKLTIKNSNAPVIMDLQDGTSASGIKNLSKERYETDKYCYENVAGIIHRGSKVEIPYYKKHGYKINCQIFKYLDYCNKKFFADCNAKKLSYEDGEHHLISMGSGMNHPGVIDIIKKFAKQKIHFHLYTVPHSLIRVDFYKEYYNLNKTEKYFHLEKAVSFDKVGREIAKYDFGSLILHPDQIKTMQPEYLKMALSYRIFTWLEAGLPIIISDDYEYMKSIIDGYNIGFGVSYDEVGNLHSVLDKFDNDELKKNVLETREELSIDNYDKNLTNFYDTIIGKNEN